MTTGPSKFDRLPKALASVREFNSAKAILMFLIGGLLYFAHMAFVPVALAVLFALILSSPVEKLHHLGVARGLSALFILVLALSTIAGLVALTWNPAQEWYASAPQTIAVIQRKITPVARLMSHLEDLTSRAGAGGPSHADSHRATLAAYLEIAAGAVLQAVRESAIGLATFVIITLFLLAGGPPMAARMTAAFFDHLKANHVQRTIERVRAEVAQYYLATTFINLTHGIATTIVMMALGMPTPYVWGAMAALLNFIPYVGAAITWLTITLVAIVTFDGLGHAVAVSLSYVGLATIGGQVVQPLFVGRKLEVNPLLIFLGLWFGGLFWGIAGVILATPILVALKVIAENSLDGKSMMQFLGPNDVVPRRYHRLRRLARRT